MKNDRIKTYNLFIQNIYKNLYSRSYMRIEFIILAFVEEILTHNPLDKKQQDEDKKTVDILYMKFNETYLEWITSQGKDTKKEEMKHKSNNHLNYYIAHCFDPSSMGEILWQLKQYLDQLPHTERKSIIKYALDCYKSMLGE